MSTIENFPKELLPFIRQITPFKVNYMPISSMRDYGIERGQLLSWINSNQEG
jgi:hypothetical protein